MCGKGGRVTPLEGEGADGVAKDLRALLTAHAQFDNLPALLHCRDGEKVPLLLRVARRELVSVHWELRALLYLGVLLVTGGVGVVALAAGLALSTTHAVAQTSFDFAPPLVVDLGFEAYPHSVDAGDLNEDGFVDVVLAARNNDGRVVVLLGARGGVFQLAELNLAQGKLFEGFQHCQQGRRDFETLDNQIGEMWAREVQARVLTRVGILDEARDILEQGRRALDLVFSQRLGSISLRLNLENLTDSKYLFTQGVEDQRVFKLGRTIGVSVGYSLF